MASMTEILEETLDPPTMAANGLLGTSTAPNRGTHMKEGLQVKGAGCRVMYGSS